MLDYDDHVTQIISPDWSLFTVNKTHGLYSSMTRHITLLRVDYEIPMFELGADLVTGNFLRFQST